MFASMHVVKLLTISALLQCCNVSTKQLPHKEKNQFIEVHGVVQNTLNDIFMRLKLNKNMTLQSKNRQLLIMHAFMKTLSEKSFEAYKNMKTASRSSKFLAKDNSKAEINDADQVIERLAKEILIMHNVTSCIDEMNDTIINLSSLEIPRIWNKSLLFLKQYYQNIVNSDALTVKSAFKRIKEQFLKSRKLKTSKILKAWQIANIGNESEHNHTRRIFQGINVDMVESYPFITSVHVAGDFLCAGSIISVNLVLTAATCLTPIYKNGNYLLTNFQTVQVRMGSSYTNKDGFLYGVSKVYQHPEYDSDSLCHNLAILKLNKHIKEDNQIRRVVYWIPDEANASFDEVTMLGWGDVDVDVTSEYDPLKYTVLKLYNLTRCMDVYTRKFITNEHFCAGFETVGSGACQRDVGGPALVGDALVGVVSFGPPACGTPDGPTVFSNISYYAPWIDSIINIKTDVQTFELLKKLRGSESQMRSDNSMRSTAIVPKNLQFLKNVITEDESENENQKDTNEEKDSDEESAPNENEFKRQTPRPGFLHYNGDLQLKHNKSDQDKTFEALPKLKSRDDEPALGLSQYRSKSDSILMNEFKAELLKSSLSSGSSDPMFLALKSLGSLLGLDKFIQIKEKRKQNNKQVKVKQSKRSRDVEKSFETDSADPEDLEIDPEEEPEIDSDLSSEDGSTEMSIEYSSVTAKETIATTKHSVKTKAYHDNEDTLQKILLRNFVLDPNAFTKPTKNQKTKRNKHTQVKRKVTHKTEYSKRDRDVQMLFKMLQPIIKKYVSPSVSRSKIQQSAPDNLSFSPMQSVKPLMISSGAATTDNSAYFEIYSSSPRKSQVANNVFMVYDDTDTPVTQLTTNINFDEMNQLTVRTKKFGELK